MGSGKVEKILDLVQQNQSNISQAASALATNILATSGNFIVVGVGTSSFSAMKFAHLLNCYGVRAQYRGVLDLSHGQLGALRSDDQICAISLSGKTHELVAPLKAAKLLGIKSILVTADATSPLAKLSVICHELPFAREIDPDGGIAVFSSLLIATFLAETCANISDTIKISKEHLLQNHPAGNLGVTLKEKNSLDKKSS